MKKQGRFHRTRFNEAESSNGSGDNAIPLFYHHSEVAKMKEFHKGLMQL